jgi:hypothetical protein
MPYQAAANAMNTAESSVALNRLLGFILIGILMECTQLSAARVTHVHPSHDDPFTKLNTANIRKQNGMVPLKRRLRASQNIAGLSRRERHS